MSERISTAYIDNLFQRFQQRLIEKRGWTHQAHLLVAFYAIKNMGLYDGLCVLKTGIILLNQSHQTLNDGTSGYHETLTVFWCKVIHYFLLLHPDKALEESCHLFFQSSLCDPSLPFQFYEKVHLMSAQFRAIYHEPQGLPLNQQSILSIL